MKKFFVAIGIVGIAASLCACGNMSLGFGNYQYDKVHVDTHHYTGCLDLSKWYDNDSGIEVATKKYGNIFLSEGTYIMVEGECPFCDSKEK